MEHEEQIPHSQFRADNIDSEVSEYRMLLSSLEIINSSIDLNTTLDYLMELAKQVTCSDAASALLVEDGYLVFAAASGVSSKEVKKVRLELGEGIAGWVVQNHKPLVIPDVSKDNRFTIKVDAFSGFKTKSILAVPLKIEDRVIGVVETVNKRDGGEFGENDVRLLITLANSAAMAIHKAQLYADLNDLFISTIKVIANAIEAKDRYLHGHSERIKNFSLVIANELQCKGDKLKIVELSALLHDVGKIGVPEAILTKKDKLTSDEFKEMQKHPSIGADMISSVKQLNEVIPGIRHHQERFDGKGYPGGLSGSGIPLIARIIAVADTFDAMTSDRTYRSALSDEQAVAELEKCSGAQFDPDCVSAFIRGYKKGLIVSNWTRKQQEK